MFGFRSTEAVVRQPEGILWGSVDSVIIYLGYRTPHTSRMMNYQWDSRLFPADYAAKAPFEPDRPPGHWDFKQ